ncbi:hypothetical protein BDZ89DRAFT_815674 [Hymenopellis radicata]|nr:hypothetical protein BDZ89DRAFT_815674 [Hymenopellis radicata]
MIRRSARGGVVCQVSRVRKFGLKEEVRNSAKGSEIDDIPRSNVIRDGKSSFHNDIKVKRELCDFWLRAARRYTHAVGAGSNGTDLGQFVLHTVRSLCPDADMSTIIARSTVFLPPPKVWVVDDVRPDVHRMARVAVPHYMVSGKEWKEADAKSLSTMLGCQPGKSRMLVTAARGMK